jgi:allantoicase
MASSGKDDLRVGADHSTPSFTSLADLASARVGGRAIATNDDFFAPKSNLVKPEAPIFIPDKYTRRGKWMDGWESRRRRTPGHDWCIVQLGLRGIVHGVNVDTSFFTGNYPSHCSIEAIDLAGAAETEKGPAPFSGHRKKGAGPFSVSARRGPFSVSAAWRTILPKVELKGDGDNLFAIENRQPWTHLRLNIFPDGGVARLRVYGEAAIDWRRIAKAGKAIDLASILNGGLVLGASDMHFGARDNMIMPGRARNMGDGWETRRRRGPGHDWAIVRLGTAGTMARVEIDTNHYKGNYPESASLEGCLAPGASLDMLATAAWTEVLPRTPLQPHRRHYFAKELRVSSPISHVRINIFPDGGISRLRIHGTVAAA